MLKSIALTGVVVVLNTAAAHASTITGTFGGSFSAPTGHTGSNLVSDGSDTSTLNWGAASSADSAVAHGNASSLSVKGGAFDHGAARSGEFLLGSITWNNQSNWHAGGTWGSILTLNLGFDTPGGASVHSTPISFSVENTIDAKYDTSENEILGSNPDALRGLIFDADAFDVPINLGNGFQLSTVTFRLDDAGTPGTAWADLGSFMHDGIASGSEFNQSTGLWETREGATSTIGVYGTISAVPLPAGVWLMISGLGGLVMMRRRAASADYQNQIA